MVEKTCSILTGCVSKSWTEIVVCVLLKRKTIEEIEEICPKTTTICLLFDISSSVFEMFAIFDLFVRVRFVSVWHCVYHKISASKSLQDNEKLLSAVKSSRLLSLFEMFFNCAKDLPRSIYFMLKQICIEAIITYTYTNIHIYTERDR